MQGWKTENLRQKLAWILKNHRNLTDQQLFEELRTYANDTLEDVSDDDIRRIVSSAEE